MSVRALALAALLLATGDLTLDAQTLPAHLRSAPASTVVRALLTARDQLGLGPDQVAQLTRQLDRLQHDRGRPVVTGLDRVPGKSVPRVARIRTSATEAFAEAARVLTREQQADAARILNQP